MKRLSVAALALAAGLAGCDRHPVQPIEPGPAARAISPATGHILDLGVLPGGTSSEAFAISDAGMVVGVSVVSPNWRAFRWTADDGMVPLPSSRENAHSYAHDVNAQGQVVGYDNLPNHWYGASRALLWEPDGTLVDLTGQDGYQAFSINDQGHVVGRSTQGAWLWTSPGNIRFITPPPVYQLETAYGINDRSEVVGTSEHYGVYYWSEATGVISIHQGQGEALGINEHGQVTGWIGTQNDLRAFVWTRDDGLTLIEPPEGFYRTRGTGINDQGQVVGFMERNIPGLPSPRAFVWSPETGVIDLDALPEGVGGAQAYGINDQGFAVGGSHAASGAYHAVRWDVNQIVPPPNDPPTLRELEPHHSVQAGQVLQFEVEADDPDGDQVTIVAVDVPPGAQFSVVEQQPGYARARFQWVPQAHQVGTHEVTFRAVDEHGAESEPATVTIEVTPADPPPPRCTDPELQITAWSGQRAPGTISLGDADTWVLVYGVEPHIPPHDPRAAPEDLRLGDEWETATPARSYRVFDADQDGNRDVRVRFETQRLVADGNLSPGAQEVTIWGRNPVTQDRFCGTTNVTVVP